MAQSEADQRLLVDKWNMLCEMEIVGEKGVFIFGQSGSLTYSELYTTLKVTILSKLHFVPTLPVIKLDIYIYNCIGPVHAGARFQGLP